MVTERESGTSVALAQCWHVVDGILFQIRTGPWLQNFGREVVSRQVVWKNRCPWDFVKIYPKLWITTATSKLVDLRMAFYQSSRNFKLEGGQYLVAECENMRHEWYHSVFPLNDCLGNRNGHFLWGGQGFKQSDRNTSLRDGRYLQAELCNMWGGWGATRTDLESCISNDDGNL